MKQAIRTIVGAGVLLSASCASSEEPKRHPLAHVVHITASLTFDGKPVRIDDLIDCYASYTGTPTSSPHMVFKPNRVRITHEVPGGGMIKFGVSRELCYVNGDQWGSSYPSYAAPVDWTPVLEWYDDRDVLKRTEGIVYLSETALKNPDGRLKINDPFKVSTPEHPASQALLNEVEKQAAERDWYQGRKFNFAEKLKIDTGPMEWMVRIPEENWRDPLAARPNHKFINKSSKAITNFSTLSRDLGKLDGDDIQIYEYGALFTEGDNAGLLVGLIQGQFPNLQDVYEMGIPKANSERFGLLRSDNSINKQRLFFPYYQNFFDKFFPFKRINVVMTTS